MRETGRTSLTGALAGRWCKGFVNRSARNSIGWWEDANHFVNWGILVAAFGQLLICLPLERWAAAGLAVGFGAVTSVLWEFAEYYTFIRNSPELRTAYTETLGDLALGPTGLLIAAALTTTVLWPKRS